MPSNRTRVINQKLVISMQPYFSIVVPTLNRCDTLKYTIDTIFNQNYESFELIVSDNCSADETEAIVAMFQQKRSNIRYIKPSRTLSMSRHWEFALSHAHGEYVAFVGDDDGMVPNALPKAHSILQRFNQPEALSSLNCEYHWLSSPLAGHSNIARYPLTSEVYERDSQDYLKKISNFDIHYRNLPLIYNSFVKKDVISKVKSKTGNFFSSCIPDVYSGIAVASQTESFVFSEAPLFIYGVSGHSNGANSSQTKLSDKSFFIQDSIPFYEKLPYCVSIPVLVAESIYQCIDAKLLDVSFLPDPEILVEKAVLGSLILGKERYLESVSAIQKYAEQFGINAYDIIKSHPYVENSSNPFPDQIAWSDKILDKDAIGMKMDAAGVRDIYGFHSCMPEDNGEENSTINLYLENLKNLSELNSVKNSQSEIANELAWMKSSISWKLTQPLRDMLSMLKS